MIITDSNGDQITFNSPILLQDLGSCTGSNPYSGNPTSAFKGQDSGELFAYVNVFDTTGYINNVVFFDASSTGLESSNDTLGYANPFNIYGTSLVPEPGTLAVFGTGLAGLMLAAGMRRRRV
jgi:hypothetical protein